MSRVNCKGSLFKSIEDRGWVALIRLKALFDMIVFIYQSFFSHNLCIQTTTEILY